MTLGLAFWIIMLIWLVFGGLLVWGTNYHLLGFNLLLFVLLMLLGWKTFGAPLHG